MHECEMSLFKFVSDFEKLYGCENITFNVHLLTHMVESVRQLGPLWSQSTFSFEGNNGTLVRYVKGTSSVLKQIAKRYSLVCSLRGEKKNCVDIVEKYEFSRSKTVIHFDRLFCRRTNSA